MELIICLSAQGKGSLEGTTATPSPIPKVQGESFLFQFSLVTPTIRGSVFQKGT